MQRILITGGTGYIGSHTALELAARGHTVELLDNLSNSHAAVADTLAELSGRDIPLHPIDLRDADAVDQVLTRGFDAVIHFAGLKSVADSVARPLEYYDNNITGSLNLVRAMDRAGTHRLVFSSSATVYGAAEAPPFAEHLPRGAINPYGWSKAFLEQIFEDMAAADARWRVIALRYFNPVGAHRSGRLSEQPKGAPANLMPHMLTAADGGPALTVFGDDYPTPDGTCIRDYIHVQDLATGHAAALEALSTEALQAFEPINLGRGAGVSVLQMLEAFEAATGVTVPHATGARRPGDAAVSFAAVDKAKRLLNWTAQHDVAAMCRDAWAAHARSDGSSR